MTATAESVLRGREIKTDRGARVRKANSSGEARRRKRTKDIMGKRGKGRTDRVKRENGRESNRWRENEGVMVALDQ